MNNIEVMIGYNWSGQNYTSLGKKNKTMYDHMDFQEATRFTMCKVASYIPVIGAIALFVLYKNLKEEDVGCLLGCEVLQEWDECGKETRAIFWLRAGCSLIGIGALFLLVDLATTAWFVAQDRSCRAVKRAAQIPS